MTGAWVILKQSYDAKWLEKQDIYQFISKQIKLIKN